MVFPLTESPSNSRMIFSAFPAHLVQALRSLICRHGKSVVTCKVRSIFFICSSNCPKIFLSCSCRNFYQLFDDSCRHSSCPFVTVFLLKCQHGTFYPFYFYHLFSGIEALFYDFSVFSVCILLMFNGNIPRKSVCFGNRRRGIRKCFPDYRSFFHFRESV